MLVLPLISRTVYLELLNSLEKDVIKEPHSKPNPFWKNLANYIVLVDEFLFHPTIHRYVPFRYL
jgi:hypothetical protein